MCNHILPFRHRHCSNSAIVRYRIVCFIPICLHRVKHLETVLAHNVQASSWMHHLMAACQDYTHLVHGFHAVVSCCQRDIVGLLPRLYTSSSRLSRGCVLLPAGYCWPTTSGIFLTYRTHDGNASTSLVPPMTALYSVLVAQVA
jgi:hypothetical protein